MFRHKELYEGRLIRRYKRFLVDVDVPLSFNQQKIITIHNPNTGSMRSLLKDGQKLLFSKSNNLKRKYMCTLEYLYVEKDKMWVNTNTMNANRFVEEAIKDGLIDDFGDVLEYKREFKFEDSRIDFFIKTEKHNLLLEVKSVTHFNDEYALFPDAVTARGLKHLKTLQKAKEQGYTVAMLYLIEVNRNRFRPAHEIDEKYSEQFWKAKNNGVHMLFYRSELDIDTGQVHVTKMNNML